MIRFRDAEEADLPAIIALLADDALGATRENPADLAPYRNALRAIAAYGGRIVLAVDGDEVLGCLQLDLIPNLSLIATTRAQVEGVRVVPHRRGEGIGAALMHEAIRLARDGGAGVVQLTTNLRRRDVQRFYARLGFAASHAGMKLALG